MNAPMPAMLYEYPPMSDELNTVVKYDQGYYHIEAETKLPPLSRRYFQMHFLEWKSLNVG